MPRLFVAVWPPDEVLDLIAALPRPEVEGLRWTTRDQWHVTLRFFGSVELAPAAVALRGVAASAGASDFFRGSVVAYDSSVKFDLLGVPSGPVVSEAAARAMAEGAAKVLGADIGIGVTGVAGPTEQEGQPVGTVVMAVTLDGDTQVVSVRLPGQRDQVRQFACISLLDFLRRRLQARELSAGT